MMTMACRERGREDRLDNYHNLVFYLIPIDNYQIFNNLLKRAIKTPKLYLFDVALAIHLLRIDSVESLEASPAKGELFETYVINEIIRSYHNVGKEPWFYYYRDTSQREIDLVFEANATIHPIEIKTSANPSQKLTSVFRVLESGVYPRGTGGILCTSPTLDQLDGHNWKIPAALI
jgi:predicted AAA+ superfamily ATPase